MLSTTMHFKTLLRKTPVIREINFWLVNNRAKVYIHQNLVAVYVVIIDKWNLTAQNPGNDYL